MKRMLIPFLLLAACTDRDAPPRGAIEGELAVTAIMGAFDPEKSMTMSSEIYIIIDDEQYALRTTKNPKVVGEPGVAPMFLGGRKVIVKGKIKGDEYYASYLKWLPDDGEGDIPTVTLGIPVE